MREVNNKRLKAARLYQKKTIDQLAKETGLAKKDILCFEEGRYEARDENIFKVAKALNFPKKYFYEYDMINISVDNTHSRTQSFANKGEEIAVKEKLLMVHRIIKSMEEHTTFPESNLPKGDLKFSSIDDLVIKCKKELNIPNGPIQSLAKILEANGIIVWDRNVERKGMITFTQKHNIDGEITYLIALGNDNKYAAVRNYDLAYELGNIIGNIIGIPAKKMPKDEFACALLLPRNEFLKDLKDPENLDAYIELKKKWVAPISCMIFRAYELGVLNYKKYNSLMMQMDKRGWLNKEPLDESMKDTTTIALRAFMQSFIDKDPENKNVIMETLIDDSINLFPEEVELLVGLKKGSLK